LQFGKSHIMWLNYIVGIITVLTANSLFAYLVGCTNILAATLIYLGKLDKILD